MKEKANKPKAVTKSLAGYFPAARNGDIKKIRQLLDDGVNIDRRNQNGETTLMQASAAGRLECVQLLLDRGADVNAVNKYG